jgi:GNAT superfamily N-acetyltransferase
MYKSLGFIALKSGEQVEAGVIDAPDTSWSDRLEKLLGHKPSIWLWQIKELLSKDVGVEAYFHVLHRSGQLLSQIMTVETSGVGILGHVWTEPEDRGQGAAPLLLQKVLESFHERDGKAMYLGTSFRSTPYGIYKKIGFTSIENGSGVMAIFNQPQAEFEQEYFAQGETVIEPISWLHWPSSAVLLTADLPGVVRNVQFGLLGRALTEEPLMKALHIDRTRGSGTSPRAYILRKLQNNGVTGLSSWGWHPQWPKTCVIDLYCHPEYWSRGSELLGQLSLPVAHQTIAYCDAGLDAKLEVLRAAGFKPLATLPHWVARDAARTSYLDVQILVKSEKIDTAR